MPPPNPFLLDITDRADAATEEAVAWLLTLSEEAAQRFAVTLQADLETLCARWGEGFRPPPDERATLYYSHPVFEHLARTSGTRRRSNSGVWRVFYDVTDADGDGSPDTLRVLNVRHGAARPLSLYEPDSD